MWVGFFDFGHVGAYKGREHVIVAVIGGKNGILTAQQQSCSDVHG